MRSNLDQDPVAGQVLLGQTNGAYLPRTLHGDATIDENGDITVSGSSGGITGLTAGFVPLAGSAITLTEDSPIDSGVTTPDVVTIASLVNVPAHAAFGVGNDITGKGTVVSVTETSEAADGVGTAGVTSVMTFSPIAASVTQGSEAYYGEVDVNLDGTIDTTVEILLLDCEVINMGDIIKAAQLTSLYAYVENAGNANVGVIAPVFIDHVDNDGTGVIDKIVALMIADQDQATANFAIQTGKGVVEFGDDLKVDGVIRRKVYSVATTPLPSAVTEGDGATAFVSDAVANTFNTAYVGSGTNKVPVFSDGAVWRIG